MNSVVVVIEFNAFVHLDRTYMMMCPLHMSGRNVVSLRRLHCM